MPNIVNDGLIDQAFVLNTFSRNPTNPDFLLQSAVAGALNLAAAQGLFTASVNISAYANSLVQLIIQRLTNAGYVASLSSSTLLSVTWS